MNTNESSETRPAEMSFEVAEQIVIRRIVELYNEIKKREGTDPFIALNHSGYKNPTWNVYENGVLNAHGSGESLAEALANVPNPDSVKRERIAKLEEELAKLKDEPRVAVPPVPFNESDCGGVFDGNQVVSDADPGM